MNKIYSMHSIDYNDFKKEMFYTSNRKSCFQSNDKLWFRGVRSSKFRHVFGQPAKREKCYDNINITKNAHDSHFCAVNPKFIAIVTEVAGGGAFIVLPLELTGRIDFGASRVTGHSGTVLDIKWNPFNDNVIASCSDDCTIKLWYIPDNGLTTHLSDCTMDLHGHKRRVGFIEWHPTAENVLASAGYDYLIIIWDVSKGEALNVIDCHSDVIYCMSFNRDGSRLVTTSKDKKLRIIDPRSGCVINEGNCHHGARCWKAVYLKDGRVATVGFSRHSDRQLSVWSENTLEGPLATEIIDSSSGVIFPYYDYDTNILFLAGKGDGNIRYYEIVDSAPWVHFLNQYISGLPQKSLGFMPKRGCNLLQCEIFRFYKLHTTKPLCEPVSMIVPRKSDQFQDDLYPDTAAPIAVITAEEWISGVTRQPQLISLRCDLGNSLKTYIPRSLSTNKIVKSNTSDHFQMKLAFLNKRTVPDYRPIDQRDRKVIPDIVQSVPNGNKSINDSPGTEKIVKTTLNTNTKFQKLQQKFEKTIENEEKLKIHDMDDFPKTDFQKLQKLFETTIVNNTRSDMTNSDDDTLKDDIQLQKAYGKLCEEVKSLRYELATKEKRIQDLETLINKLQTKLNDNIYSYH